MNSLKPLLLLALALTSSQVCPTSSAATIVWDGGGANAKWGTANNWSNNQVPSASSDILIGTGFGSGKTLEIFGTRTANSLTLSNATGVTLVPSPLLALGGHILHLTTGKLTSKSYGDTTVNCRLHLTVPGTVYTGYNQHLALNGAISGAPNPSPGSYFPHTGLRKDGEGELILGGANTFAGAVYVADGQLTVASSNALPYTILFVQGHNFDPTMLHFNTSVTPNINYLLLEGETVVTGGSGAKLYAGSIGLRDKPDVDLVLAGSANVYVADGAEAILRRANTFTGDIRFGYGGQLTVQHESGLGSSFNTLNFEENGELVVDDFDGLVSSQRTLFVAETAEAQLNIRNHLNTQLSGAGDVVIMIDGSGTVDLGGDNTEFTGQLFSNKSLNVTDSQAFGSAIRVVIEAGRDITFDASVDAPDTDLETSSGSVLTLNNRNVTVKNLRVGSGNDTLIQLSADATDRTLQLNDITFLGSGDLDIEGWLGSSVGSIGDKVAVSGSLSASELARIRINGLAVKKLNGELVLAQ